MTEESSALWHRITGTAGTSHFFFLSTQKFACMSSLPVFGVRSGAGEAKKLRPHPLISLFHTQLTSFSSCLSHISPSYPWCRVHTQKHGNTWQINGSTSRLHENTWHNSTPSLCRCQGRCRHTLVWNEINISRILTCTDIPVERSGAEPLLGKHRCEKEEKKGGKYTPMLWGSTRNATHGGREEVNPAG